jgi:hypothetical protein
MKDFLEPSDEILDRLRSIDWLACQEDVELDLPFDYRQLDSKHKCEAFLTSTLWQSTTRKALNRVTQHLHDHHSFEYDRFWNDTVDWITNFYEEDLADEIADTQSKHEFNDEFADCVERDIRRICLENAFKKYNVPIFFHHLLEVYEAGLFPCGWEGGWPEENGTLLIY